MSDIVETLRKVEHGPTRQPGVTTNWYRNPDGPEAADEIERLRARLETAERLLRSQNYYLARWYPDRASEIYAFLNKRWLES